MAGNVSTSIRSFPNLPGMKQGEYLSLCSWWFQVYQKASLYCPPAWRIHLIPEKTAEKNEVKSSQGGRRWPPITAAHLIQQCEANSLWVLRICDSNGGQVVISYVHVAKVLCKRWKQTSCKHRNSILMVSKRLLGRFKLSTFLPYASK